MKLFVAILMCLAVVQVATAGYTDELWNESEDRVYYDCGDWSGVSNAKDISFGSHYYFYSKHRKNGRYMFTPTNWGYPSDAKLKSVGFSDIAWTCVHIRGFDKTLNFDGEVYTDDPAKINYKTSYLRYKGWSTRYWTIYHMDHSISKTVADGGVTVKNKITFYGKHSRSGKSDKKKVVHSTPADTAKYKKWASPNSTVTCLLINHSNYMTLKVPTPTNLTGIRIVAESENRTAIYEKHTHCLKLNTSKSFVTCDLVEYEYHHFEGIVPFGSDMYLLASEPDYNFTVTLFTPFETVDGDISIYKTAVPPEKTRVKMDTVWDVLYLLVPISLTWWLIWGV